ncbi:MAG: magnesium transporter, partial [Bacteroidia bacterium]|nr:magnesium transporter [Bacteroidia bacterium]
MEQELDIAAAQQLLEANDHLGLESLFENWLPADIAEVIPDANAEQRVLIFKVLDRDPAFQTFELLDIPTQQELLDQLLPRQLKLIMNDMSADDRTELLENLDSETLNRILTLLTSNERIKALSLLGYPEESIGRLMTPDYVAVQSDWTVGDVFNYIRKYGETSETLNVVYVVNNRGKLIDDIKTADMLLSPLDTKIEEIMDDTFVALNVTDDEEEAIQMFKKYTRVALPVTDANDLLLGIVTIDDVLELAEEEDTEDIQKIGAVEALEEPYMDVSIVNLIKKRAPWLVVLFLCELFAAKAMSQFDEQIAKAVVLAIFIPLIISSGGNTGSQAATLIVRALAIGEITLLDWWRIMRKEIFSGLILGIIIGVLGFATVAAFATFAPAYQDSWVLLAMTVSISLLAVVLWGTLTGSMLPLVLKRFGA